MEFLLQGCLSYILLSISLCASTLTYPKYHLSLSINFYNILFVMWSCDYNRCNTFCDIWHTFVLLSWLYHVISYLLFFNINNLLYEVWWQSTPTGGFMYRVMNSNLTYTVTQYEKVLRNWTYNLKQVWNRHNTCE